ncbi:MAG: lytic transglycosylase domain-containing protein [Alphaproteobacteria bacterium]
MREAWRDAKRPWQWALGAFFVVVVWGATQPAEAGPREMRLAAVSADGAAPAREAALPRVLSEADVARYAHIFALQKKGKWRAADREIAKLDDRILMGHVLAQRYLHPTAYRSKFRELRDWLAAYADHPEARRIYKLAMRRKAKSARAPRRPIAPVRSAVESDGSGERVYVSAKKRTRKQRRKLINLIAHIRKHLRKGEVNGAAKHLTHKDFLGLADDVEYDIVRAEVAYGYFLRGKSANALELADASAARSGAFAPLADWTAGLAAYRLGEQEIARRHFEALAHSDTADAAMIAAGAYWAARLNLITRRPQAVSHLLAIAAAYPRTFYGLLGVRALGATPDLAWELPPLTEREVAIVRHTPPAMRALALVEVGQTERAGAELRRLEAGATPGIGKAMLALAARLELPAAQLRIARRLVALDGRRHDGAMFPVPTWEPKNGFRVDRALLFALMRQESQFNARAKSRVGARGLMQLMPRTASFIARDRRYRSSRRNHLFNPELNIELGQKYVLYLLDQPEVQGNLAYAVAAYNGGPGNLRKWRRRTKAQDDPLLFIESVPSRETREFVQTVLTNLWLYRARLGQSAPSLATLAGGGWPVYTAQDSTTVALSLNAGN